MGILHFGRAVGWSCWTVKSRPSRCGSHNPKIRNINASCRSLLRCYMSHEEASIDDHRCRYSVALSWALLCWTFCMKLETWATEIAFGPFGPCIYCGKAHGSRWKLNGRPLPTASPLVDISACRDEFRCQCEPGWQAATGLGTNWGVMVPPRKAQCVYVCVLFLAPYLAPGYSK